MSWRLKPSETGILGIDLQEKLLPAMHDHSDILQQAIRLVQFAALLGLPIVFTEHAPAKLGPSVIALRSLSGWSTPLAKSSFSAAEVLPKTLPTNLIVMGLETHICVRQTVYDLRRRGHTVYLMADAVGSRRHFDSEIALQEMRADGVLVTTVEAVCYELLADANHPQFKAVWGIFK